MDELNPTASDSGASTLDRIEAYLAADDSPDASKEGASQPNQQPTTDKPASDAQAKDDGPQFTTAHLAQYLGVDESEIDVDEAGQPVFKTKIDGKERTAKFDDLRKTYQLQGHAENRTREAAEKEKAAERKMQEAEQAIAQRHQQIEQQMQQVGQMAQVAQQELSHDYNSINWNELWQSDPGRAGLLEKQFQQRSARIGQVFGTIQQQAAQARAQAEYQSRANEEQTRQKQMTRLFDLVPEWKDAEVANKERTELVAWIDKSGFDASELDLNKASSVALLRKAWQHATLQQSRPELENKVRTAPKLVKPGAPSNSQEAGREANLRTLKQTVRNSTGGSSTKALADWLLASGKA